MQARPAVISRNPDIFCRGGHQFFGKRANQPGIDAGKLIDLLANALEIIVISRVFSRRTGHADRSKPAQPAFRTSLRLLSQQGFIRLTGGHQILQNIHYSVPSISLLSVLSISACAVAALSTLNI